MTITALAFLVFAEANRLDPNYDAGELAQAIARVSLERPAFDGEDGALQTAAWLLAIAWHETDLRHERIGDGGRACTAWQLHAGPLCAELRADKTAAARVAREYVRTSLAVCSTNPVAERLAAYTSGSCSRGLFAARRHHARALKILDGMKAALRAE